ncbi:MAG: hypothetical protein AAF789_09970 [Bacteroidota bacterium]
MIIASLRTLEGELVGRERLEFKDGNVMNYRPCRGETFEGSIEIEAFANDNLVIPYIAVMVMYQAPKSVSMVHSYGRAYTFSEMEDGNSYTEVEESGLVLRDTEDIHSYMVFHNGVGTQPSQPCEIQVMNHKGETKSAKFDLPELKPYATIFIRPSEHIPDLVQFLDGEPGAAATAFKLNGGFTRGLCVCETSDGEEMQVYHTNFNYNRHDPGTHDCEKMVFYYPNISNLENRVVHPDPFMYKGKYFIDSGENTYALDSETCNNLEPSDQAMVAKPTGENPMPRRINLTFSGKIKGHSCRLPLQSARNFYSREFPDKFNLWVTVGLGKKYRSQLVIQSFAALHGPVKDSVMEILLYREGTKDVLTKKILPQELEAFEQGIYVDELFPEAVNQHENEIGSVWCKPSSYGTHHVWATIEPSDGQGGSSIEHSF